MNMLIWLLRRIWDGRIWRVVWNSTLKSIDPECNFSFESKAKDWIGKYMNCERVVFLYLLGCEEQIWQQLYQWIFKGIAIANGSYIVRVYHMVTKKIAETHAKHSVLCKTRNMQISM